MSRNNYISLPNRFLRLDYRSLFKIIENVLTLKALIEKDKCSRKLLRFPNF